MKTAKKIWIIVAVCLVVLGTAMCAISLAMVNFEFKNLSTGDFVHNEYIVNEDFNNIKINVNASDIDFVRSETQECKVTALESHKVKHTVSVKEDTLLIGIEDNREWYDYIGVSFEGIWLTIHLPKDIYDLLNIEADTSDINVSKDFSFNTATIETDTGDVRFLANSLNTIDISTDTGNIEFDDVTAREIKIESDTGDINLLSSKFENVDIKSDTGNVDFNWINCESLKIKNGTGNITALNTIVAKHCSMTTSTGDVIFEESDADTICIKTSTGDVHGTLLSEKVFIAKSSTGDIGVPDTTSGGKCEITTDTGVINIDIIK